MAKAISTKDIDQHKQRLEKVKEIVEDTQQFKDKTFAQLSEAEKDVLLRRIAIDLGYIKE
jgi:hypothetical protein